MDYSDVRTTHSFSHVAQKKRVAFHCFSRVPVFLGTVVLAMFRKAPKALKVLRCTLRSVSFGDSYGSFAARGARQHLYYHSSKFANKNVVN